MNLVGWGERRTPTFFDAKKNEILLCDMWVIFFWYKVTWNVVGVRTSPTTYNWPYC